MRTTRAAFIESLKACWPGATYVRADRGLYVCVGTKVTASLILTMAQGYGLRPRWEIDQDGDESFTVAIFGFPREKKVR